MKKTYQKETPELHFYITCIKNVRYIYVLISAILLVNIINLFVVFGFKLDFRYCEYSYFVRYPSGQLICIPNHITNGEELIEPKRTNYKAKCGHK